VEEIEEKADDVKPETKVNKNKNKMNLFKHPQKMMSKADFKTFRQHLPMN
jgi:hypothetical protein